MGRWSHSSVYEQNSEIRKRDLVHALRPEPKFTTRIRMYSLTIEKKLEAHGSSVL